MNPKVERAPKDVKNWSKENMSIKIICALIAVRIKSNFIKAHFMMFCLEMNKQVRPQTVRVSDSDT